MSEHNHRWAVYEPTEDDFVYKCLDCDTFRTGAQRLLAAEAEVARLDELAEILEGAPELNMSNYDDDLAAELNGAMIAACLLLREIRGVRCE